MVHRRELDGQVLVFGNQGALWQNAMTWFDHDTGTVWSQPLGEAIVGPRKGAKLEIMASTLSSWGTWKETHPDTLALDASGGPIGFRLATMTIVVDFGAEVGIFGVEDLVEVGPANETIAGVPIAVVIDPRVEDRWNVFSRLVGDQVLTLALDGEDLVDLETGTRWDPGNGRALAGPLEGEFLNILPGFTAFRSNALDFWPEAKVWSP
jgi:hypothetical protein